MWEAFEHAAHYELDNLTAIIDVNRLGQRGETMVGWDVDKYVERARAFGWNAIPVDGHDVEAIDRAYAEAIATTGRPTVVVARTLKGKGVAAVEDENGFHGKPLDDPEAAFAELGGDRSLRIEVAMPSSQDAPRFVTRELVLPTYEVGAEVATRKAYGDALAALGSARDDVVALDGEVSNSTFSEVFAKAHPDRFFQLGMAEQVMLGAAAIQPLVTKRTETTVAAVVRGARLDRWRRVALASVKQSGRAALPEVRTPLTIESFLDEPPAALRLMLVEPAVTLDVEPLSALRVERMPSDACVLVGPEGGWTEEECLAARERGVRLMSLGHRTLRADAVPIAALSVLSFLWDEHPA